MSYGSNNNAKIYDNCKNLKNLIVTLEANFDLITKNNVGFSLQLNCYPQTSPQATYSAVVKDAPLYWFQYVIYVFQGELQAGIQYWAVQPQYKGDGYNPGYATFGSPVPTNSLPKGSVMRIELDTDDNGHVGTAWFSVTPKDFNQASRYVFNFPSTPYNTRWGIYGFEVNLVGCNGGDSTFTSAGGILTYMSDNTLSVQTSNNCGGYGQPGTAETSNIKYGDILAPDTNELAQRFWF